jgi:hydroxyquinol 1,2-dioxygenase
VNHREQGATVTQTTPHQPDAAEQQAREQAITNEVVASFATSTSERYREVMTSLVRHLHGFAREVRLTHAEWEIAIDFLTRTGQECNSHRQEFILLSDVLGLSMLTVGIKASASDGATESTVFEPFFLDDAPEIPLGGDLAQGAKDTPCWVSGQVRSTDGNPWAGVRIDAWEAGRGRQATGPNGEYRFWSVLPTAYPIPDDGPVGELITAAGRRPMRPAHPHFKVTAPGHRTLITHVFVADDEYLDPDAVFGVEDSLIADFTKHTGGNAPDGTTRDGRSTAATAAGPVAARPPWCRAGPGCDGWAYPGSLEAEATSSHGDPWKTSVGVQRRLAFSVDRLSTPGRYAIRMSPDKLMAKRARGVQCFRWTGDLFSCVSLEIAAPLKDSLRGLATCSGFVSGPRPRIRNICVDPLASAA